MLFMNRTTGVVLEDGNRCCLGKGQQVLSSNRAIGVVYEQDNMCCL